MKTVNAGQPVTAVDYRKEFVEKSVRFSHQLIRPGGTLLLTTVRERGLIAVAMAVINFPYRPCRLTIGLSPALISQSLTTTAPGVFPTYGPLQKTKDP